MTTRTYNLDDILAESDSDVDDIIHGSGVIDDVDRILDTPSPSSSSSGSEKDKNGNGVELEDKTKGDKLVAPPPPVPIHVVTTPKQQHNDNDFPRRERSNAYQSGDVIGSQKQRDEGLENDKERQTMEQKLLFDILNDHDSSDDDNDSDGLLHHDPSVVDTLIRQIDESTTPGHEPIAVPDEDVKVPQLQLTEAQIAGMSGEMEKAEARETMLSQCGNYRMVTPLHAKRDQARTMSQISRVVSLQKLALVLLQNRNQFGLPTTLATHYKFIAVGTSRGVVLVFDHYQTLAMVLGQFNEVEKRGAVTALDIAPNADYLVAGHANGPVVWWDILNKSVIKAVNDAYRHPVVLVRCTQRGVQQFVASDIRGFVNIFSLQRILFTTSSHVACLLDGKAGPILSMAVLRSTPNAPHITDSMCIIALATERATLIVQLEPTAGILFKVPRNAQSRPGALPCLSFRSHVAASGHGSRGDGVADVSNSRRERQLLAHPILLIGRGRVVELFQLSPDGPMAVDVSVVKPCRLNLVTMGEYMLPNEECVVVHWLSRYAISGITNNAEMFLVDPVQLRLLETSSLRGVGMNYHERFVNPHTKTAELCYHNSVSISETAMVALGMDQVVEVELMSWSDRVNLLRESGKWIEALVLALDFLEGKASVALGLPNNRASLRQMLMPRIVQLLMQYVELALAPTAVAQDPQHLKIIGGVAIDYCTIIDRTDILFSDVYQKFRQCGGEQVFLELLEPYILNDKLTHVSGELMRRLVEHYQSIGKLREVEQCILHMDIGCLDFQQIVTLCRQRHLFSALVYIYNRGCDDYYTPFCEIMDVILAATDPSAVRVYGYKLLLYINKCMKCEAFPIGSVSTIVDNEKLLVVTSELVAAVFHKASFLSYFLELDANEILKIIDMWMDDDAWYHVTNGVTKQQQKLPTHQGMFDVLMHLAKGDVYQTVCVWAAKWLAKHTVSVSDQMRNEILTSLITSSDSVESLVMELLEGSNAHTIDSDALIMKAESVQYYRVCSFLYKLRGDHIRVLDSYIKGDSESHRLVFDYVHTLYREEPAKFGELKSEIITRLPQLVRIGGDEVARLIIECFAADNERVLAELHPFPELQLEYLRAIMAFRAHPEYAYIEVLPWMHEKYIELLCQHDPSAVYQHVMTHSKDLDLRSVLELCRRHQVNDATAFLLERTGDIEGALELLLRTVEERVAALEKLVDSTARRDTGDDDIPHLRRIRSRRTDPADQALVSSEQLHAVESIVDVALDLCSENSRKFSGDTNLWFRLLDCFLSLEFKYKARDTVTGGIMKRTMYMFVRSVLASMMNYVSLQAIMRKLTSEHANEQFQEFRDTIEGMLNTYTYEKNILRTANRLLASDMYVAVTKLHFRQSKAFVVRADACGTCGRQFNDARDIIMLYDCGHGFHKTCLGRGGADRCTICSSSGGAVSPTKVAALPSPNKSSNNTAAAAAATTTTTTGTVNDDSFQTKKYMRRLQLAYESQGDEPLRGADMSLRLAPKTPKKHFIIGSREPGAMPLEPKYTYQMS